PHVWAAAIPRGESGNFLRPPAGMEGGGTPSDNVDDEAAGREGLVRNGDGVVIVPPAAGIDERLVEGAVIPLRRQLQRATVVDRGLDGLVIEEGGDVGAKLGVPFTARGLGIAGAGALDDRGIERGIAGPG